MLPFDSTYIKYNRSLKGCLRNKKYRTTTKAKLCKKRFYAKYGGKAIYERKRYHEIQNKAGCYMKVNDFYPGYLFIQALKNAEVVDLGVS